jgi:hypothetical protein
MSTKEKPAQQTQMKVFYMNDCDWMAGESLESCKTEYLRMCSGGKKDDPDAFDDPYELTPEQMRKMKFNRDTGEVVTFQEQLNLLVKSGAKFPLFFASTEY